MIEFVDFCRNRGIVIPDEIIEENNAPVSPGSKIRIVDCTSGPEFKIGQVVTVVYSYDGIDSYEYTDGEETWWLSRK